MVTETRKKNLYVAAGQWGYFKPLPRVRGDRDPSVLLILAVRKSDLDSLDILDLVLVPSAPLFCLDSHCLSLSVRERPFS